MTPVPVYKKQIIYWNDNTQTICLLTLLTPMQGFFKENVRYPVWICRDLICLILRTWFSLIIGTRW